MGIWRTLYPRRILPAPGAISVYGGISSGEPRTQVLGSGAESSSDLPTAGQSRERNGNQINYSQERQNRVKTHTTVKYITDVLKMNVKLLVEISLVKMPHKRKWCECLTRLYLLLFDELQDSFSQNTIFEIWL